MNEKPPELGSREMTPEEVAEFYQPIHEFLRDHLRKLEQSLNTARYADEREGLQEELADAAAALQALVSGDTETARKWFREYVHYLTLAVDHQTEDSKRLARAEQALSRLEPA